MTIQKRQTDNQIDRLVIPMNRTDRQEERHTGGKSIQINRLTRHEENRQREETERQNRQKGRTDRQKDQTKRQFWINQKYR